MNYIKLLEGRVENLQNDKKTAAAMVDEVLRYLSGEKFQGVAQQGERKDWVSTSDMVNRLREIRSMLN